MLFVWMETNKTRAMLEGPAYRDLDLIGPRWSLRFNIFLKSPGGERESKLQLGFRTINLLKHPHFMHEESLEQLSDLLAYCCKINLFI